MTIGAALRMTIGAALRLSSPDLECDLRALRERHSLPNTAPRAVPNTAPTVILSAAKNLAW